MSDEQIEDYRMYILKARESFFDRLNDMYNEPQTGYAGDRETLGAYTAKTFGWMAAGLFVTFAVAYGFAALGGLYAMLSAFPAAPFLELMAAPEHAGGYGQAWGLEERTPGGVR